MTEKSQTFTLRPLTPADRSWVKQFTTDHWGSDQMVVHAASYLISQLPGFVAQTGDEIAGLITYTIDPTGCEILSLDSLQPGRGIGTALIQQVKNIAVQNRCRRLFLSTTNDNLDALRFYQKLGFIITEVRCGAVNLSRKIKPEIPVTGNYGIPIRDEIELEIDLT